jgi:hypothetical protein
MPLPCRRFRRTVVLSLLLLAMLGTPSRCLAFFDTTGDTWALLGGYGQSFPGWGQTTERVETLDIVPRYNHVVFDRLGSGWY